MNPMNADGDSANSVDVKETKKVIEAEVFNNNPQEQEADL